VTGKGSSSSSASSAGSDDPPSLVEHINLEHLALVATKTHPEGLTCTVNPHFETGSFNVVWFLEFSNGDQWVARVPRAPWSPMLERRLRSDMLGYELISHRTSIPIPKIFAFSPDIDNVLGYPFTLMSRAKGIQLSELWFDPEWFTNEHRHTFFYSLAENMAQLKDITFPKIGSLELDDNGVLGVGPVLPSWQDLLDQPSRYYDSSVLRGPFDSVHAFFSMVIAQRTSYARKRASQVHLALLRMFALSILNPCLDDPPFVLSMPNLNLQNIFITGDGRISCIIDWDGIEAVPRQGGYARYPSWITRDWNPWSYRYPARILADQPSVRPREQLKEDSPSMLQQFRNEYLAAYEAVDPTGAYFTQNSQVFEAIRIACTDLVRIRPILHRLTRYTLGPPTARHRAVHIAIQSCFKESVWVNDYISDAEKFTSDTGSTIGEGRLTDHPGNF